MRVKRLAEPRQPFAVFKKTADSKLKCVKQASHEMAARKKLFVYGFCCGITRRLCQL